MRWTWMVEDGEGRGSHAGSADLTEWLGLGLEIEGFEIRHLCEGQDEQPYGAKRVTADATVGSSLKARRNRSHYPYESSLQIDRQKRCRIK